MNESVIALRSNNGYQTLYVIGSLSRANDIKTYARWRALVTGDQVKYVKPQPDKPIEELISQCFDNIEKADVIEVFRKKDGTIGTGTLYEMQYAYRIGKTVEILSI